MQRTTTWMTSQTGTKSVDARPYAAVAPVSKHDVFGAELMTGGIGASGNGTAGRLKDPDGGSTG
jgi:hypothetical protein